MIKSRYSVKTISSTFYSSLTFSGTSNSTLGSNPGYIYVPYIMQQSTPPIILDREWERKILRADRKEKLQKLGWS